VKEKNFTPTKKSPKIPKQNKERSKKINPKKKKESRKKKKTLYIIKDTFRITGLVVLIYASL